MVCTMLSFMIRIIPLALVTTPALADNPVPVAAPDGQVIARIGAEQVNIGVDCREDMPGFLTAVSHDDLWWSQETAEVTPAVRVNNFNGQMAVTAFLASGKREFGAAGVSPDMPMRYSGTVSGSGGVYEVELELRCPSF